MASVKHQAYRDDLTYEIDYNIDKKDYLDWKDRLTNQLLKTVEVPGFRKGKAPYKLAIKHINEGMFAQTLTQETVMRFYPEAMKEAQTALEKDKRTVQATSVITEDNATGEQEDGSFQLRVLIILIPEVDLTKIEKIETPFPKPESIKDRPSESEMIEREKKRFLAVYNNYDEVKDTQKSKKGDRVECDIFENGVEKKDQRITLGTGDYPEGFEENLIGVKKGDDKEFTVKLNEIDYTFKLTVKKVLRPTYSTFKDVLENDENAKNQFESEESFETKISSYYKTETDKLLRDTWQSDIIQEAVKVTPDFSLPQDRVNSEIERIVDVIQNDGVQKGISLKEAFELSGIPSPKPIENDKDLKAAVTTYVEREFKWTGIIDGIYHTKVEKKFTPEQIKEASKQIKDNKAQYKIPEDASDQYIEDVAFDRLKRYTSSHWLFDVVDKNIKKDEVKEDLKEIEKAAS